MPRFDVGEIVNAGNSIDPLFLNTPQFEYEPLSEELGANVVVKLETANPIRSFKGRGADLLVSAASGPLVCASAGNFGQAMAYACQKRNLPLTIFASVNANPLKVERMRSLGASVSLKGADFDEAKEMARHDANEWQHRFVEDSKDVETAIGAGTIGLELINYQAPLDYLLIPVGNGALINGIGRVFKSLQRQTKIVGVQAKGAPAMLESWREGRMITYNTLATIADGIGVRLPVAEALEDMKEIVDDGLLVEEESIIRAMKLLFWKAGILAEPSAAVGVAAMLENRDRFRNNRVGIIICGSNLTAKQVNDWII